MSESFRFAIEVEKRVKAFGQAYDREAFFEQLWNRFGELGLAGVHEGTVLTEQAAPLGLETESWTIDSGEAPRERDWIGDQKTLWVEVYCESLPSAQRIQSALKENQGILIHEIEKVEDQDWDAQWKASFQGSIVEPFWEVLPPWVAEDLKPGRQADGTVVIRLNPGAGFGTGTHETTQLCLEVFGRWFLDSQKKDLNDFRILDFGSGSGILAFAAGLLGAKVSAIEIDPLAIDNGNENAEKNGLSNRILFKEKLEDGDRGFDLVFANILRPVLLQFQHELISRLKPGGILILSGLVENDVSQIVAAYGKVGPLKVFSKNEWRAVSYLGTS